MYVIYNYIYQREGKDYKPRLLIIIDFYTSITLSYINNSNIIYKRKLPKFTT